MRRRRYRASNGLKEAGDEVRRNIVNGRVLPLRDAILEHSRLDTLHIVGRLLQEKKR